MKPFTYFFLIALISLTFSCNDDDDDEVVLTKDGTFQISELAGTWEATKAQFSVSTVSIDVVEDGGTASMSVQSNGRFTLNTRSRRPECLYRKWRNVLGGVAANILLCNCLG